MKVLKIAFGVALGIFFAMAGCAALVAATASNDDGGGVSITKPTTPATHLVTYKLTGSAATADLTYGLGDSDTRQQSDVDVPLVRKSDGGQGIQFSARKGDFLYFSAQNGGEYGSLTCTIEVDGVPVKTNTSSGGFTIVTCSGSL